MATNPAFILAKPIDHTHFNQVDRIQSFIELTQRGHRVKESTNSDRQHPAETQES